MKKKIILTETQYIKLTDSLLEDINRDLKHLKNGDILTFELMNGNKVNLKIASVNINNNEILGYGPNNEKIMLRIGEFNNEKGILKFYQYNDNTKKYIAQKISIKDMDIFRDNELFVPDDEAPTYNHNNNPSSKNVGFSDYFKDLKFGDTINILDINGKTTSIKVDYIGNDEIYGNDSDNNNLVVKYIDEDNNKIFLLNDNGEQKTINYKSITISNKDSENIDDENNDENNDEEQDDYELFHKYYDEILNNPNLQKAFYTAPSLWNYILAAAKGEKAIGKGIYPAYQIINNYFNSRINDKLPGFTDKENKRASFYLLDIVKISYREINGKEGELIMEPNNYKATVRQYEAGLGDVKVLTYKAPGGNFGFKLCVKKPTGFKQDEYYCDIYVNNNKVEENIYVQKNVRVKFINSDGYTSYDTLKKNK